MPSVATLCGQCLREPPPFSHAVAALNYAFPWDGLIAGFKFHDQLDVGGMLASLLVGAVRRAGGPPPSLIVPVPLSPRRLRERGYNQAWELARRVARAIGVRGEPALLARPVDTPRQTDLPRDRRAANVRGSFAVESRGIDRVRGATIALVDDVMTTGATAGEAARVLLGAGAGAVQVWVAARTPHPADA